VEKIPTTLFICCCDHRIMPYELTKKELGELFVLRNIGNLVPKEDDLGYASTAAIEYAVGRLRIPEIIVCGHSDCGGMKVVMTEDNKSPGLKAWLAHAAPVETSTSTDESSKANVLYQIENLKTHMAVKRALQSNTLKIHAWWVDLATNNVYCYDWQTKTWQKA